LGFPALKRFLRADTIGPHLMRCRFSSAFDGFDPLIVKAA
jgi:hypothetical protein